MNSNFIKYKKAVFIIGFMLISVFGYAQSDDDKWKLQLALGINNPIDEFSNDGFFSKDVNFPSINFGVQHMFTEKMGAKLDVGYNRSSNDQGSREFKLNYTRVNLQFVYDATSHMRFLPEPIAIITHLGPGISISKPLGNASKNESTYINMMAGVEMHYKISKSFSVFGDVSYAFSLSNKNEFNPFIDGFSFSGDLLVVSFGISVSLNSNCSCF